MADTSPAHADPVPGTVEVAIANDTPQPVPLCNQQPPAPEPFTYSPTYPDGCEWVDTLSASGGLIVEHLLMHGGLFERRFNTATGDSELRPLF